MKHIKSISLTLIICLIFISNNCAKNNDNPIVVGEFSISKVIDGDTFKFEGLENSARLLGIDTEETFKTQDAELKSYEISLNWESYYNNEKGVEKMPAKPNSPFGFETYKWAKDFFNDVKVVRLERDDTNRTLDIFNRHLVYVIAEKNGKEINYNVECVRQGFSPYYNKYGNSKRFHTEFLEAQTYAMNNKLGIWSPDIKHYPDYEERIQWWNKRAEQIENFEAKYSDKENYFNISDNVDFSLLEENLGNEITVFGSISDILDKKFPYLLRMPHTKEQTFELVIFEENKSLIDELNFEDLKNYYIYASGKLGKYKDKYQIVLNDKSQIRME